MNKDDEVYAPDGVPAGQIIRDPATVTETVTTHSGRETAYHLVVGQQPTTVAQQATTPLRERLRLALRRHIDPDDDTMPALWRGDGFIWLSTDSVLDDLIKAIDPDQLPAAQALHRVQELANTHSSELPDALDVGGEYETGWDSAMDAIKAAIDNRPASGPRHPITSHPYKGDGFLHPCTALGFGSMCGSTQWDHMEEQ
ncbi:hypothetical protein ABZS83_05140 [Streptomyces sp. NPDC005426]|uniref:hypothetical protein n=1 Tax=Streptomyces sp. NPDC005426 TaxID=3155344 RepID=UPI0033B08A44